MEHVREAGLIGADVCTVPPKVLDKMVRHHLTDEGLEQFLADWRARKQTSPVAAGVAVPAGAPSRRG